VLRFEITEHGGDALPAVDLADDVVVIGSSPAARIRLPAAVADPEHVRFVGQRWELIAEATIGGMLRAPGDAGSVGHGLVIELGRYRVRVTATPVGSQATSRQRTESLARELVRSLLGEGAAPTLEITHGTHAGARRPLPAPEARVVIGRGDEADWVILDEDLSRTHAELRRGWDGVTVVDLGSKNGTRVDRVKIGAVPVDLHDGASLALGRIVMRFSDPAERHLRGEPGAASPARPAPPSGAPGSPAGARSFYLFVAIACLALAALVWILAS
jgi:hypothetical protein